MLYTVCANCITYNHVAFIKEAMDGFCMQKTTFPFVCVLVDDASTDGTDEVIKEYISINFNLQDTAVDKLGQSDDYYFIFARHNENLNCYFAVYLLKNNHYQRRKSKALYSERWFMLSRYIALCEGDDYWINPEKLQRQVSFLDNNPDYSMTCHKALLFSVKKNIIVGENYCYPHSREVSVKDTIYRRGLFISTCSIVYRKVIGDNKPDYWVNSAVGDYPLQIACVLKGKVWYFNEPMAVYRIENSNSWVGKQNWYDGGADPSILKVIQSSIKMFKGFAKDYPQYMKYFKNKIADEINRYVPTRSHSRQIVQSYLSNFKEEIMDYSLFWKIDLLIRKSRIPYVRGFYCTYLNRRFANHNKMY